MDRFCLGVAVIAAITAVVLSMAPDQAALLSGAQQVHAMLAQEAESWSEKVQVVWGSHSAVKDTPGA
jgi:hypothetical protein